MSTQLRNVPGCRFQNELTQTKFWGGKDRMQCIQVTQRRSKEEGRRGPVDEWFNHLSLDRLQAKALAVELMLFAEGREVTEFDEMNWSEEDE